MRLFLCPEPGVRVTPIANTQGFFSTGRDITVVLIHPAFGQVQLANITGYESKQDTVKIKSNRLDGVKMLADLPDGWSGSIMVDRGNPALDTLMAQVEAAWIDQGAYNCATMYEYITEVGGAQSIFIYDNVALSLDDAGNYQPDAVVKQKIGFSANRRRHV
jgi:hypothetical protein